MYFYLLCLSNGCPMLNYHPFTERKELIALPLNVSGSLNSQGNRAIKAGKSNTIQVLQMDVSR